METNPRAYFSWGDLSVPVEQGNMVVFDGQVPHQTVIEQGSVHLLGPFDAETFRMVGAIPALGEISNTTALFGGLIPPLPTLPTFDLSTTTNWVIAFALIAIAAIAGVLTAVAVAM